MRKEEATDRVSERRGDGEGEQCARKERKTGRRGGESCQNQQAFEETCLSCWIQGFSLSQHSGCYCTFLFSLQPLWGQLRVTHHPVWEQSWLKPKLHTTQNSTRRTLFSQTCFIPSLHVVASRGQRIFKWVGLTFFGNMLTFFTAVLDERINRRSSESWILNYSEQSISLRNYTASLNLS